MKEFFYALFWAFLQLLDFAGYAALVIVYGVGLAWLLTIIARYAPELVR